MTVEAGRPRRADARRNYDQILTVAAAEIARSGADASLEEIARLAGVGSATLHRHFPTRYALLEAVFHDRVEAFCAEAREKAGSADPGAALIDWLIGLAVFGATTRGLGAALLAGTPTPVSGSCEGMLTTAGTELVAAAHAAGSIRPDASAGDLLTLVNAISLATENSTDPAGEAARLLTLALEGIRG